MCSRRAICELGEPESAICERRAPERAVCELGETELGVCERRAPFVHTDLSSGPEVEVCVCVCVGVYACG